MCKHMDCVVNNVKAINDNLFKESLITSKAVPLLPPTVFLVVVSKVPSVKKVIQINLPHRPQNLSVCLLVRDTNKFNYDKSNESWKRRWALDVKNSDLSSQDIPSVVFLPLRELKLAYQTYAARRRLAATFDVFLADRRIVHHLPTNLGKAFYGELPGKMPIPSSFTKNNLVQCVLNQLNTVLFVVRGNGTTQSLPIGNTTLTMLQLKENILSACQKIFSDWPGGGAANIRSMYVQTPGVSIPLYLDETEASIPAICEKLSILPKSSHHRRSSNLLDRLHLIGIDTTSNPTPEKHKTVHKRLPRELAEQVADDLPLPPGGIEEIFNKQKTEKIAAKRKIRSKTIKSSHNKTKKIKL